MSTQTLVLKNEKNQHSLWQAWLQVPAGWNVVFKGSKEECEDYIETHWTDLNVDKQGKLSAGDHRQET